LLFYGTSIVHGAAASRAGMCHPAILGRRLGLPVVNLGFGGQGQMDPEVAALLAELDPSVYVIDCLPNMNAGLVEARAAPLVHTLRAAHPHTPIILVEDRSYANAAFRTRLRERNATSKLALTPQLFQRGELEKLYYPGQLSAIQAKKYEVYLLPLLAGLDGAMLLYNTAHLATANVKPQASRHWTPSWRPRSDWRCGRTPR
jgi:hypothetical protein